ncbi:type-F conjugative transfer system protein TraW [Vibrio mediterranei]|uniref:type-F conjugative transfer system protein TraW n=1 Tax=Vibrio mediterranei TaxID=689 RepID=UPI001EFE025F|nr:type-F conjugative transfer system protein TraW [Vibrio mediterranei]MCG9628815.1 type-F conjugative transfer system protein TraW [Vibrio mediterranei]
MLTIRLPRHFNAFLLTTLTTLSPLLYAKDLGTMGESFAIGEVDMLDWIHQRLAQKQADGTLQHFNDDLKAELKRYGQSPTPVEGLSVATRNAHFTVDPSLRVPQDITDNTGRVIVPAGTRVNPFERLGHRYPNQLAFFDGRDPRQVAWASRMSEQYPNSLTLILIGGDIKQTHHTLKHKLWFDQGGYLSQKLHLRHVPSLVYQEAMHWRIEEFNVNHNVVERQ